MSTTTHPTTATQLRVATPVQYDGVERLAIAFEKSAKRWEMVAYPAMVLFTLLAVFGFYKIYSVSENMRVMAERLQPQMGEHMDKLTNSMESLTANISQMSRNIDTMQQRMVTMSNDTNAIAQQMRVMATMDQNIAQMNQSVQAMTAHTDMMRWNIATMNRSIQRPMNFMNSFMPW
jgi:methyl-accepting chemotaxis protein